MNGPLYILDKETRKLTTYLNFNGLEGQPGIFHRLNIDNGLASGFICFQFDPDYAHNGKFYTIHLEDPALPASNLPDNKNFPGFKTAGYTVTPAIRTFAGRSGKRWSSNGPTRIFQIPRSKARPAR